VDIIPELEVTRFEQLAAGDLFLCINGDRSFYALKTAHLKSLDGNGLVTLGPAFADGFDESSIMPWQAATTLKIGKSYSILLSSNADAWRARGPYREPVWLAIAGKRAFVCTNGGPSPNHYFSCFVDVETGEVHEGRLPGISAFTSEWEIVLSSATGAPWSVMKFPLATNKSTSRAGDSL
jgi:hypothetical protein